MYYDFALLDTMIDQSKEDFIEKEMERVNHSARIKLNALSPNSVINDQIALMFCYCWQESLPVATKLAQELNLCKLEIMALMDEFDGFKEEYLKEIDKAGNF